MNKSNRRLNELLLAYEESKPDYMRAQSIMTRSKNSTVITSLTSGLFYGDSQLRR